MKKQFSLMGKVFTLIALITAQSEQTFASGTDVASPDGYMITEHVDEEFILDSSRNIVDPALAAPMIESYIRKVAPNRERRYQDDLSTEELAQRIAGAAYCFQLDPFVFAALIRKESILYDQYALSPTGAVGYTQFTTIAVKEVNDQLGLRPGAALKSTTAYLNERLTSNCLAQYGGYKSFGANYVPLWKMGSAAQYGKGTSAQAVAMKKMLDDHPEYGIVYGAILLKVDLSLVKNGMRTGCLKQPVALSMKDTFEEVLMFYNGDHCGIQVKYQQDILHDFYEGITGRVAF